MGAEAIVGAVVSGLVGAGASKVLATKPKADPSVAAAQKRQEALLEQQKAAQTRLAQQTDAKEAELSGSLAAQRRAVSAKARGRGSLSYVGPSGLKTTLGG